MASFTKEQRLSGFLLGLLLSPLAAAASLSLPQAVDQALQQDVWLDGSRHNQAAALASGEAAAQLPDPVFKLALANLPTDTLDIHQEPMTQLIAGVSQKLPRGDSLELQRQRGQQNAQLQPLMRIERRARVRLMVSQLYLDAWQAQQSLELIEQNRSLFEQLVDISTASYSTALGRTRQQDLLRAELELTQLDERISVLHQQREKAVSGLSEWLGRVPESLNREVPEINGIEASADQPFLQHPSIRLIDQKIDIAQTEVRLVEQQYRPAWGLNASYSYRADDLNGRERADLFTVGVTVDMPLFSSRRQDSEVAAATARVEALKTERILRLRQLQADFQTARAVRQRLTERLALYSDRLLPESHEAAEAALNAYTSDAGDFAEVVRARITELNAHLTQVKITAELLQQHARLGYLLVKAGSEDSEK